MHSNGVMRVLNNKLNFHIKKACEKFEIPMYWSEEKEKKRYPSKIDFIPTPYRSCLLSFNKKGKVLAIVRATENVRTFATNEVRTKEGNPYTKQYSVNKNVSKYYIFIDNEKTGHCYLKLYSYLPFVSEFCFNSHNYLKMEFDLSGAEYTTKENIFTKISIIDKLNSLISEYKSIYYKSLHPDWFSYQTGICTNLFFKSARFANAFLENNLAQHHIINLPDKLTEIYSLSLQKTNSNSTQNKIKTIAVIKHWSEGSAIQCYNKSGCLLRVETTINKKELPGLKLKKPAIKLIACLWYGLGCNSNYIEAIRDIDQNVPNEDACFKYQVPILNSTYTKTQEVDKKTSFLRLSKLNKCEFTPVNDHFESMSNSLPRFFGEKKRVFLLTLNRKGVKITALDLQKDHHVEFPGELLLTSHCSLGFRNKNLRWIIGSDWETVKIATELRKLRACGVVNKLQYTHYYQFTKEVYVCIFHSLFRIKKMSKPLLSRRYQSVDFENSDQASIVEGAYSDVNHAISLFISEFKLVS